MLSISQIRLCSTELHIDIIKTHSFKMPPTSFGGSLLVNSSKNVHVQPTNTLDFPDLDQAFVKILSEDKSCSPSSVNIIQDEHKLTVTDDVTAEDNKNITIHIEIPIVYNVSVTTSDEGRIRCRDMIESDYCHLISDQGNIEVASVKTSRLNIKTKAGNVKCKGAIQ